MFCTIDIIITCFVTGFATLFSYCNNIWGPVLFQHVRKATLSVLPKAAAWSGKVPLVLHMDSTYKLKINEYPVLVLGISDTQQQIHMRM
jgi:hypothetical protein